VTGWSKGRGFAGGIKRHGFARQAKTHGQSDRHRAPGSIGTNTDPGRVIKGKRMAGHYGNERVTVRNLQVVWVDPERHLIALKGAVPGPRGGLVIIRQAKRPY
jgi:large subunit ribosomal protein L3